MHKISNFTGAARHGWEKMSPSMGFGTRPHNQIPVTPPPKQSLSAASLPPSPAPGSFVNLSFNVPFSSNLAGPEIDDVIYASPGAFHRWTHPQGTGSETPNHKLPVHAQNIENLRKLCRELTDHSGGQLQATVVSAEPKPIPGLQRGPLKALITNVCLSGETELVHQIRGQILKETPILLKCATVDIDYHLIMNPTANAVRVAVLSHMDEIAKCTKADTAVEI